MSEDVMPIGSIYIHYYLGADGQPIIRVDRPELDDVSMAMQFGMIEFARLDIAARFQTLGREDDE